jgi:hypothetical protein
LTPASAPAPENLVPPQHVDLRGSVSAVPQKQPKVKAEAGTKLTRGLSLRSQAATLSAKQVKDMLQQHDFFCREESWSKEWSNPRGRGIDHDFELQQNGLVVFDDATGLMWQQSGSQEYMNYSKAENYIRDLNNKRFAGFTDWRLPTLEEAMSLMEPEKHGELYLDAIFDHKQTWIWTADKFSASAAWVVNFYYGHCYHYDVYNYSYVRAVRGGQSNI